MSEGEDMSELKNCPTGIGHKRVLEIEKLEQAKLTLKHLCKNAPSVLYAEDLYMIESLIDAEIIKTETTASPRFTAEEREAMNYCMNTTRDLDPWSGYAATQMYILCYDEIDLYMSALRFLCECGQEKVEKSKEATQ